MQAYKKTTLVLILASLTVVSLTTASIQAAPDYPEAASKAEFDAFVAKTEARMDSMDHNIAEIKTMLSDFIHNQEHPSYQVGDKVYGRYIQAGIESTNQSSWEDRSALANCHKPVVGAQLTATNFIIANNGMLIQTGTWSSVASSTYALAAMGINDHLINPNFPKYYFWEAACHPILFEKIE